MSDSLEVARLEVIFKMWIVVACAPSLLRGKVSALVIRQKVQGSGRFSGRSGHAKSFRKLVVFCATSALYASPLDLVRPRCPDASDLEGDHDGSSATPVL